MQDDQLFIPLNLYALRIEGRLPFAVYLRNQIGKKEHAVFAEKGSRFTVRGRQKLLLSRERTLYVAERDRAAYHRYAEDNFADIVGDRLVPLEAKAAISTTCGRQVLEELFGRPSKRAMLRAVRIACSIVDLMAAEKKAAGRLLRLTEHDYQPHTHAFNVGIFSIALAMKKNLPMSRAEFHEIGTAFFLHDIGKTRVPDEILNKPGPLDKDEWDAVRKHPETGCAMLLKAGCIGETGAAVVRQHHERPNGSGYPEGLRGDRIHPCAMICSVADTFDAMTTRRAHQSACSAFDSLASIRDDMLKDGLDRRTFERFVRLLSGGG